MEIVITKNVWIPARLELQLWDIGALAAVVTIMNLFKVRTLGQMTVRNFLVYCRGFEMIKERPF